MKRHPSVNFDRVARAYRWMEYVSFGPALARCRYALLPELADARHALVLGDGDGRFLQRLLTTNDTVTVDAVDSSRRMLKLLAERAAVSMVSEGGRIRIHHADALSWTPIAEYDLIVSHFFLDCFFPEQIEQLLDRVLPAMEPGARWVISEFAVPDSYFTGHLGRGLIRFLYAAFGVLTGLRVRRLPDFQTALQRRGLRLLEERRYLDGLLCSQLWCFQGDAADPTQKSAAHAVTKYCPV